MIIFKKIIKNNIYNSDINPVDKKIHNFIIKQLKEKKDKYCYYKYINKSCTQKIKNIFNKSQKIYFILIIFAYKFKYRKAKIYNIYDLNYDLINNSKFIFKIYKNRFIYQFTYIDFINIVKHNIFYYREIDNNEDTDVIENLENDIYEIVIESNIIKNPYTNEKLSLIDFYNFYNFLLKNNIKIPLIIKMSLSCNFNLHLLGIRYQSYIIEQTFKIYTNNICNKKKKLYFRNIIIFIANYIIININKDTIKNNCYKYILDNDNLNINLEFFFKTNKDLNFLNIYIYYYLLNRYNFKTNNLKGSIHYKFLLIYRFLQDTNINFDKFFLKHNQVLSSVIYLHLSKYNNYNNDYNIEEYNYNNYIRQVNDLIYENFSRFNSINQEIDLNKRNIIILFYNIISKYYNLSYIILLIASICL